jgi:hypothetical protein
MIKSGLKAKALAMQTSCFCPLDKGRPPFSICVSSPENFSNKKLQLASYNAFSSPVVSMSDPEYRAPGENQ